MEGEAPAEAPAAIEGAPPADVPAAMDAGARSAELEVTGWIRRFVAASPRLQETAELYRSLGLEVRFEAPGPGDLAEGCEGCRAAMALFRVIYTRRPI